GERVWSWRSTTTPPNTPPLSVFSLRGADGKVLRQYTKSASGYTWEDYVYREGQLLAAAFTYPAAPTSNTVDQFDLDHRGSVRRVTDKNGAYLGYHEYWPYGEELVAHEDGEAIKFTGHQRDLGDLASFKDDVDYMHARYFRPLVGRFLS